MKEVKGRLKIDVDTQDWPEEDLESLSYPVSFVHFVVI